jgi:hypothetical protein
VQHGGHQARPLLFTSFRCQSAIRNQWKISFEVTCQDHAVLVLTWSHIQNQ